MFNSITLKHERKINKMKPISDFRDHPALKYNERKLVFVIKYSTRPELYLFTEKEVKRILPIKLQYTNIGDPYKKLARFIFCNEDEEDSMDINPNDLQDLVNMVQSIGVELLVPKELISYLDEDEKD